MASSGDSEPYSNMLNPGLFFGDDLSLSEIPMLAPVDTFNSAAVAAVNSAIGEGLR
jgi:hypothetical protein